MMRIGVDIRVLMDKQYSGVSEYSSILLRTLLRLDFDNEYRLFYNSCRDVRARIGNFEHPNLLIKRSRYPNKFFNYCLQKGFAWPKLDRLVGGVDIFWSPHINFSNFSQETKHVLTIHDISFLHYPEFFSYRKNFWHRSLALKKLAARAAAIVAVSENTRQDIIELLKIEPEKVQTIYSGVNPGVPMPGPEEERNFFRRHELKKRFILYLGTIEPRKNIVGLIYAYNRLRDDNVNLVDLQLVLAGGSGWRNRPIYRAWEESPYRRDIKFLGYVSAREKELLYRRAEVFIYPSYYEGFGLPPLEAMARNLPVITSNVSSLPEVVGSAALTINPYDINEIAKALELVVTDSQVRTRLIKAGQEQIHNFSWEKTAKQYLELFKSL
ncbi:MAG TPA: glycosyltransferase family 1 protein [bacterium]|nr:glycosyltransferase family 1 protein [bacterium]HQQ38346.1 glycosyltransferase family 1 protein [bacterium]